MVPKSKMLSGAFGLRIGDIISLFHSRIISMMSIFSSESESYEKIDFRLINFDYCGVLV